MPFVKLDCGILNSTLWYDMEAREVFLTALLMAEPLEITEAMPQIEARTLERTGWMVPPGWYGFVHAAGTGIVRRSGVQDEPGMAALERLGAPEVSSRTPDFDGRRLVRVAGGFVVLNYAKYRERDYTAATRQMRFRKKRRGFNRLSDESDETDALRCNAVTSRSNTVTSRNITQAEAEAEVEAEKKESPPSPSLPEQDRNPDPDPEARATWATILETLRPRVDERDFETWLQHSVGVSNGSELVVAVPSGLHVDFIPKGFATKIKAAVWNLGLEEKPVRFVVAEAAVKAAE